ncbi:CheR family methyltransferase [Thermochromatium tepidum]|uniref:protein-glutamate O-methyltransferase n=1 Tax=Thermochromatium tepidum ATCC 43061 TaxID=316276 RepID=A0A6I6DY00_THETI|nr:protein-glutamate O-methyltransferase CheR [Thermochromatium tepidum]QGU32461.1 hypothetical protein E6P07_05360 [Thermochromatium tepidum ATCC 43061]
MNLDAIQQFIREHLGLNAGTYGNDLWRELIAKRIDSIGARSPEDYLARLRNDETELQALTSLITINETYFYREPQHLRLLTERLCPERLARRASDDPVRLLSVGCSTGEEPYSILMALRERYGELAESLFEVNAGDVDRTALERAQAGIYGRLSFRALNPQLQERYFSPEDTNHFRIDERLRRGVHFHPLNLLDPEYPQTLANQDVIFFRNVSIYFDEPTRRRVLERLKTLLVPGGYLIVGISETLANDFGILTLCERDGVFLFVNEPAGMGRASVTADAQGARRALPVGAVRPARLVLHTDSGVPRSDPLPVARPPPPGPQVYDDAAADAVYDEALTLTQSERYQTALERLEPLCACPQPRAKDLVLKAYLLFELDRIADALALAHQILASDPWHLGALLVLGRGARRQGQTNDAIAFLRRAIYHQPDCWPAHFQLAEVYRETGQTELARREYRIVLHQLERDTQVANPQTILIGAPALALGDLNRLCRLHLARLEASL